MLNNILKRTLDIIISLAGLVILSPLLIIIAILIKVDSKGNIIFKHKRIGLNGRAIYVYKFRTMVENADKLGPQYTLPQDNRVTKIGRKLRRLSLDEIPQLINILKGEMSIVGPRPMSYKEMLTEEQKIRSKVKPGLTGLAQVNGRSLLTAEEKSYYDTFYVEHNNLIMDIKIILKTFGVVFKGKGINSDIEKKI